MNFTLSRRRFIAATIGAAGGAGICSRSRAQTSAVARGPPASRSPEQAADGFTVLRAVLSEAPARNTNVLPLPMLTFGSLPGPVIRARRGEEVKVRLVNASEEPIAIHWHGLRLLNALDGAPPVTAAVEPGASFDYRFNPPDAGTFWYHAAAERQRLRGLFGALIIDEPTPAPGIDRDHVLVFASDDRELPFTINGAASLDLAARQNERLRLRFINASARSIMSARIDGRRLWVMALDGQPAEPFVPRDGRIVLGPGNRADVFLDATVAPGDVLPVRFTQIDPHTGREAGIEATLLRLIGQPLPALRQTLLPEPSPLAAGSLPVRMDFARALRLSLALRGADQSGGTTAIIRRAPGEPTPLFTAARGRTVMLAIDNRGTSQTVHLHGHSFRLLDRLDDGWKPYWLDTLLVPEQQTMRIAFVADNPGRWAIEAVSLDGTPPTSIWFRVN